ncbi:hypothetical protein C8R45DRAFT_1177883 [Mycena sanguinolenta]|nr:hypothetical protein C8R45DRAFT_1177883 [Mycena sanguinolenta]
MSEVSIRRNPARSTRNRVPRHPDSPVSFAPAAAQHQTVEVVSSDEEDQPEESQLTQDLAVGFRAQAEHRATQTYVAMNVDVVDVDEMSAGGSPPPLLDNDSGDEGTDLLALARGLRARHEPSDIDEVDPGKLELNVSEILTAHTCCIDQSEPLSLRAMRLVGEILRLRGLEVWPTTSPSAVVNVEGSPSGPVSLRYTSLQGGNRCIYFVGIQMPTGSRTFCEIRAFCDLFPQDGAIFLRLQSSGGPLARALSGIIDRSRYYVGTSHFPIDIEGNFASYQNSFREISSLLDLENTHEGSNVFSPIPASATRSELLDLQAEPESTPVFVLYVYHADAELLTAPTSIPSNVHAPNTSNVNAPTTVAPTMVAPTTVVTSAIPDSPIQIYLRERFAPELLQLRDWRGRDYGTSYQHCLAERQVLRICQSLGIGLIGRVHSPAVIGDLSIRMDDVVSAAGLNVQTFATIPPDSNTLPIDYADLLPFLDVMLGPRILNAPSGTPMTEVETAVVKSQINPLMGNIRGLLGMFRLL